MRETAVNQELAQIKRSLADGSRSLDQALANCGAALEVFHLQITERHDKALATSKVANDAELKKANSDFEDTIQKFETSAKNLRFDLNKRTAEETERHQSALETLGRTVQEFEQSGGVYTRPWTDPCWEDWKPAGEFQSPDSIRIGALTQKNYTQEISVPALVPFSDAFGIEQMTKLCHMLDKEDCIHTEAQEQLTRDQSAIESDLEAQDQTLRHSYEATKRHIATKNQRETNQAKIATTAAQDFYNGVLLRMTNAGESYQKLRSDLRLSDFLSSGSAEPTTIGFSDDLAKLLGREIQEVEKHVRDLQELRDAYANWLNRNNIRKQTIIFGRRVVVLLIVIAIVIVVVMSRYPPIGLQVPKKMESVDLTPILRGIENSCLILPAFRMLLDSLGETKHFPDGRDVWKKGDPIVPKAYKRNFGSLVVDNLGGCTLFVLKAKGLYFGMPVQSIESCKGNENGIRAFGVRVAARAEEVKKQLRGKLNSDPHFLYGKDGGPEILGLYLLSFLFTICYDSN